VLLGLQRLGNVPCHVGGLAALNRQGAAHFLPLGGEHTIQVMSARKPPTWVRSVDLAPTLVFDTRRLFSDQAMAKAMVPLATGIRDWTLAMAGAEMAVMEMLNDVNDQQSFAHAAQVFEGLTVLRPGVINTLLAVCRNIKVKRLFLCGPGSHGRGHGQDPARRRNSTRCRSAGGAHQAACETGRRGGEGGDLAGIAWGCGTARDTRCVSDD
jgi:hypothetical protein